MRTQTAVVLGLFLAGTAWAVQPPTGDAATIEGIVDGLVDGVVGLRQAHVAPGGAVERRLVAQAVEGDHQEQPPQPVVVGRVVQSALGAAEEAAEDGLGALAAGGPDGEVKVEAVEVDDIGGIVEGDLGEAKGAIQSRNVPAPGELTNPAHRQDDIPVVKYDLGDCARIEASSTVTPRDRGGVSGKL